MEFEHDIRFFEYASQYDWDMEPVDRSFDSGKLNEYLGSLDLNDRLFVIEIIKNTHYIDYRKFKELLIQSFEKFKNHIGQKQFYILVSFDIFEIEMLLIVLLWEYLRNMNIVKIITDVADIYNKSQYGETNLLILSDFIYQGSSANSKIELFMNVTNNQKNPNFNFHILSPISNKQEAQNIIETCNGFNSYCYFHSIYFFDNLSRVFNIRDFYPENTKKELEQRFGFPNIDKPAIYFDHDVSQKTFRSIYLDGRYKNKNYGSLFKVNPSNERLMALEHLHQEWVNSH